MSAGEVKEGELSARQLGKLRQSNFRTRLLDEHLFMPAATAEGGPQYAPDQGLLQGWVARQPAEARWAAAALARCLRYVSFAQWHTALRRALTAFLRTLPLGHEYILHVPRYVDNKSSGCKSKWWASQHALRLLDSRPPADICLRNDIYRIMTRLDSPQTVRHILVVDDAIYTGTQMLGTLEVMLRHELLPPWEGRPADYLGKLFPNWWREHAARVPALQPVDTDSNPGYPARVYFRDTATTAEIVRCGDEPLHVHVAVQRRHGALHTGRTGPGRAPVYLCTCTRAGTWPPSPSSWAARSVLPRSSG